VTYGLTGPHPFDLKTVVASTRAALASVGATIRAGRGDDLLDGLGASVDAVELPDGSVRVDRGSNVAEPGLYLLLRHDGTGASVAIAGFWVIPDGDYVNNGPAGPPDRVPPFVQEILDAATEEVWWRNLKVNLAKDKSWRPVVVLEWLPHFAQRSSLAPPGTPLVEPEAREVFDDEHRETWLEVPAARVEAAWSEVATSTWDKGPDLYAHLPRERSLVLVVRGTLTHDGSLHQGSFFLVPPELLDTDGTTDVLGLSVWLDRALDLRPVDVEAIDRRDDDRHRVGRALELPDGRVGFHASGWLTRGLGIWPARPSDIAFGKLTDRVVQQKWISQARVSAVSALTVLLVVLQFSYVVILLTRPVPRPMTPPPDPAPQPALSVCSADYQEFVEEFRCQIQHLASREDNGGLKPACGDLGSKLSGRAGDYLQSSYCALHDRARDGWLADLGKGDQADFAHFAASQACFNVLGHPYPYKLRELTAEGGTDSRLLGNPKAFLDDEALRIDPLSDLVKELDGLCDQYQERTTSLAEGAVFATHVGSPFSDSKASDDDPARLRRELFGVATVGMTDNSEACFRRGMKEGLNGTKYSAMCSDVEDSLDVRAGRNKMWRLLEGDIASDEPASLVERYAGIRFPETGAKSDELWSCHLALVRSEPMVAGDRYGVWDLAVPVPDNYQITGAGVRTQLNFDAFWRASEPPGGDFGVCWPVVRKRLSAYRPVHPLLADLEVDGWPSEEQQLCGQVCAARFGVQHSLNDASWVTRDSDLASCVITADSGPMYDEGQGSLDRLRLPWNEASRGEWVEATTAAVCAYNVIAQNLMPPIEGGYVVQERAPKEYAGETVAGSRIAGGDQGLAARYVTGLAFGRMESVTSAAACGNVATQCFSGLMLEVTGDTSIERYRWLDSWRRKVEDLKQLKRSELAYDHPWCVGIRDYLVPERESAQFDTPCVAGVEEARANAEAAFTMLESEAPVGGAGSN
jgi:hypothetical protein